MLCLKNILSFLTYIHTFDTPPNYIRIIFSRISSKWLLGRLLCLLLDGFLVGPCLLQAALAALVFVYQIECIRDS